MRIRYFKNTIIAISLVIFTALIVQECSNKDSSLNIVVNDENYGELAYAYLHSIQKHYPKRESGTKRERKMGDFLIQELKQMGVEDTAILEQEFAMKSNAQSRNIIVVKPGKSSEQIIIGAHYDSAFDTSGIDDNGSGVAVVLESIKRLLNEDLDKTVVFAFWGAEESGIEGSSYYVEHMSEEEKINTISYLNVDSIAAGDKQYIYGGKTNNKGHVIQVEVLETVYQLSKEMGLNINLNPGKNESYPIPTIGDFGDHVPFKNEDIPYVYFESSNWDIKPYNGSMQTEKLGRIMHTKYDNLKRIEKNFPDRAEQRLNNYTQLICASIKMLSE